MELHMQWKRKKKVTGKIYLLQSLGVCKILFMKIQETRKKDLKITYHFKIMQDKSQEEKKGLC